MKELPFKYNELDINWRGAQLYMQAFAFFTRNHGEDVGIKSHPCGVWCIDIFLSWIKAKGSDQRGEACPPQSSGGFSAGYAIKSHLVGATLRDPPLNYFETFFIS
ncbi:hypothetical protein ACF8OI_19195 [Aeromonas bivalvium]|uniref:hypothetical protein n=1 Tax=Aeromonas bivalvium TaxID=440079 RepID=UPI00370B9E7A